MPEQIITPDVIAPPKEGKKMWSIKADNEWYKLHASLSHCFSKGTPIKVIWEAKTFNDYNYKEIKDVLRDQTTKAQTDQAVSIFVTGVIGRCFHGTASLPDDIQLMQLVRRCRKAFEMGMADDQTGEPAVAEPSESSLPF